ncbi:MAG: acyl-CoA synthetase [Sphingomonadales bacterium]|nr:acyl-CoA synthetase [Sphingomonadales bacterium]
MLATKWSEEFPNRLAAVIANSDISVSYAELARRSNRLARMIRDAGLRQGDHIAVFMENNIRYFEVVWAALRSGLYITPINSHLSAGEAGYILGDCQAKILISSHHLADVARDLPQHGRKGLVCLMTDGVVEGYASYEEAIAEYQPAPLEEEPFGSLMLYSSGTTGRPKGVLRPLSGLSATEYFKTPEGMMLQTLWGFDRESVYLSPAPLYHTAPMLFCVRTQGVGGTVVMMDKFDAEAALSAIERHKVTHSQWVPTMFNRLLRLPTCIRERYDLGSHKVAIHSAAPCPKEIKSQMFAWWGPIIYEYYSSTEATCFTHAPPDDWLAHPGTVGRPLLGALHICDETGAELPAGQTGIVYAEQTRANFVYHNDKRKTEEARHPEHDNWLAIGDMGYVDEDGFLYLTDRATFMIISGGVNIYPQEIENVLIMHDKVDDVAVIGVPNDEMGEEVKAIVQASDPGEAGPVLESELIAYARTRLAHYKCPKSVDFTTTLPRTSTGKLLKNTLRDRYWTGKSSKIV